MPRPETTYEDARRLILLKIQELKRALDTLDSVFLGEFGHGAAGAKRAGAASLPHAVDAALSEIGGWATPQQIDDKVLEMGIKVRSKVTPGTISAALSRGKDRHGWESRKAEGARGNEWRIKPKPEKKAEDDDYGDADDIPF